METYTFLREFADSWFLIVLFVFFIGVWVFAFSPALQPSRDDAASIPMRDEKAKCCGICNACKGTSNIMKGPRNG